MQTKDVQSKEKEYKLQSKVIMDHFYCDGKKIVILDNKAFKNIPQDEFILASLVDGENESVLEALTDEEYNKAVRKYNALIDALNEEDANG